MPWKKCGDVYMIKGLIMVRVILCGITYAYNLFYKKHLFLHNISYHKTSGISRTKSQNLNVSCVLLQLSLLNPLKPGVKLRMKM